MSSCSSSFCSKLSSQITLRIRYGYLFGYLKDWWPVGYTTVGQRADWMAAGLFAFVFNTNNRTFFSCCTSLCISHCKTSHRLGSRCSVIRRYSQTGIFIMLMLDKMLSRHLKPLTLKVCIDWESLLGIQGQCPWTFSLSPFLPASSELVHQLRNPALLCLPPCVGHLLFLGFFFW